MKRYSVQGTFFNKFLEFNQSQFEPNSIDH
jgi:hypothetical protein